MNVNEYAIKRVREYFISLGYSEIMFESDVSLKNKFSSNMYADFIVKKANKPYIVVEIKLNKSFSNIDINDLKYDPSVRQVQTYAMQSGAEFFIVTNGSEFLWFKTGEDGRPKKIEPVFYNSQNTDNVFEATIGEALNICCTFLKADAMSSDFMHELVLILLARFAVRNRVSSQHISYEINIILEHEYSFDISLISRVSAKTLENCWVILSECKPENSDKKQLIDALKLLAQKSKYNYTIRVSEKLSEFLLKLAKPKVGQIILDPAANLGEIAMAIALSGNQNQIFSYCQSPEQYAFLALINTILCNEPYRTRLISIQDYILNPIEKDYNQKYDMVISAFPFGNRSGKLAEIPYRMPVDLSNIEDYMLLASLESLKENGRLVAIVPESMLFAGGKRELLRRYIVENYYLRGIISLPSGAIFNSNAKTSVMIIDKTKTINKSVFFGIANSTDFNENKLYVDDGNNSIGLLQAYEDYLNCHFINSSDYWKSFLISSDVENLRAETFLSIDEVMVESEYPFYAIKDICSIVKRGSSIKNDDKGDIPFLGPAAIRANKIDESKSSFTSNENIKSNVLHVNNGTILINNISSHLGAAALYEGKASLAINQHIIALVPIREKVLPQYLAIVLNRKDVNNNIIRMSTGVAIPSITIENLKNIRIPVPDLETQQKIVDTVSKIQNEIEEIESKKKVLEKKLSTIINTLEPEEV